MSAEPELVEVEIVPDDEPRALVPAPRRSEVLRPLDLHDQKQAMQTYQEGLRTILDHSDWQDAGRGEKFVKKSGWRKIAAWFDLSIELVRDTVERDEHGQVTRACVWARAVAASGRFADGDGYCDVNETRFNRASGRQKLENDLRGTATTRAVNRAISNLVGMGAVSAEEVDHEPPAASQPPFGPNVDQDTFLSARSALIAACGGEAESAKTVWAGLVQQFGGYMPQAAAVAIVQMAALAG